MTVIIILLACLVLSVSHALVFASGFGIGFNAGFEAVPEPERVQEPEPTPEPEPAAFALDSDYLYVVDAYRYAVLGPDKTRGQMPEVVS
jgi:hypothetical protein